MNRCCLLKYDHLQDEFEEDSNERLLRNVQQKDSNQQIRKNSSKASKTSSSVLNDVPNRLQTEYFADYDKLEFSF